MSVVIIGHSGNPQTSLYQQKKTQKNKKKTSLPGVSPPSLTLSIYLNKPRMSLDVDVAEHFHEIDRYVFHDDLYLVRICIVKNVNYARICIVKEC